MVCGYHANQATLAPKAYLTGAEWNWVTVYKTIVEAAQAGKPHPNFVRGGLKDGFVKMSPYGAGGDRRARKKQADDDQGQDDGRQLRHLQGPAQGQQGQGGHRRRHRRSSRPTSSSRR